MSEHPNARLIRHGYEAFAKGDLEAVREFMAGVGAGKIGLDPKMAQERLGE